MDRFVEKEGLKDTFPYLDNITVAGHDQNEHDENVIKFPDQERLRPLKEFPPPENPQSLKRVLGMFAYYAKWIPNFSDKMQPLSQATKFPLDERPWMHLQHSRRS